MRHWLVLLLLVTGIAAFPFGAAAKDRTGVYFGLGGSYAWEDFDNTEGFSVDDSWGINLHGGYQFNKNIALEANFDWYDSFDIDTGFAGIDEEVEVWTLMFDLKLMLPVTEQLVPYARIGVGAMEAKLDAHQFGSDTESDMAWNLGAGLDLLFTESLSLGLDGKYVSGTGDVDDINYFTGSIRLTFHF